VAATDPRPSELAGDGRDNTFAIAAMQRRDSAKAGLLKSAGVSIRFFHRSTGQSVLRIRLM
jgi:hypothetical protein